MSLFGKNLRALRERSGKTMKDVASLLGVSVVYVSDVELGLRNPPPNIMLKKIAAFLDVPAEILEDWADRDRGYVELTFVGRDSVFTKLALALAENWDRMPAEQAMRLLCLLDVKSRDGSAHHRPEPGN